jgi:hypothetical protein
MFSNGLLREQRMMFFNGPLLEVVSGDAWSYNWATLFLGEINTGTWPSRFGSLKLETVKYGNEFLGNRTRGSLRWRGPATTIYYRRNLSSERASHINKPATV